MFRLCEKRPCVSFPLVRTKALARMFGMCEHGVMAKPTTSELAAKAGISKSYASEILSGKKPTLGLPLAIHIFCQTGWRHEAIADLTAEQIETVAQIAPWQPREAA